ALQKGEVEMVMATQMRLLYLTHYLELPGFKAIIFDHPVQIKTGFNKDQIVLHSIVNKALDMVDTENISNLWMRKTFDYRSKMMEARTPWLVGMSVLLFFLTALILFMLRSKRNEGKRLEKQVQERTVELNNSQHRLEKALKAAKAADHSKSAFLANMSHEIRTPMNSILGFSELALDYDISPKTKRYLENIHMNAEWLLLIINDILDISKIEAGKMQLEKIPFNMHDLFSSCRTLVMPKAVEKGLLLHFYAEPSIGKIPLGDPTRLRQVFVNLLSNAVKFTKAGIIKLLADIKNINDNSATFYFEIRDTGIGMTEEEITKIFDPFTQAEDGTTRKYGGTGLGLAITKNIVEMMGGKLSAESVPGVGSKFSFSLTFETLDAKNEDLLESKIVFHDIEKPAFEGEVLLCEDNVMNQNVICEHLARVGLNTVVAENGKIGVEMVKSRKENGEKQFDLIFMDIHMPVMDGIEAAGEILKLNVKVPVVALTANVMSNDVKIYSMNGMAGYVGKPFTSQELWRCLMNYFTPVKKEEKPVQIKQQFDADAEFNRKIQILFLKNNRNKFKEIVDALKENDIKLAHRLAHTLKSNAGQIGKTFLQQAAADVEDRLKDGNNLVTPQCMTVLESELNTVLLQLAPLQEEDAGSEAHAEPDQWLDGEAAKELLNELEPMLKKGSPEGLNLITRLRTMRGSEELIKQIEDFNFNLALETLAGLKEK
ncbi:MAG: response regulator, partial [Treponema sp.]|nr:response regulator [Treponema sp.]